MSDPDGITNYFAQVARRAPAPRFDDALTTQP